MDKIEFVGQLNSFNIQCDSKQVDMLFKLLDDTLITNEKFNLTAIKDREQFLEKMILDSAIALIDLDLKNKKAIDIGTGAGFPGMVLKILEPEVNMTLLDSTNKKIEHLKNLSSKYGLNNNCVCDRAEAFARKNIEVYDYAFARAVSSLNILIELIAPLLKVDGYFIALKGPNIEQEISDSKAGFKKLGLKVEKTLKYILPISKEERNIVWIKKVSKTDSKYPREYNQIKKRPL